MANQERFYPGKETLGRECIFWNNTSGCWFPKFEIQGRRSCEGLIDTVCLYLKDRVQLGGLTEAQVRLLKFSPPQEAKHYVPAGEIIEPGVETSQVNNSLEILKLA